MSNKMEVETAKITDDVYALRWWMPTPFGQLAVSSYVITGKQPILIDTHAPVCRDSFFEHLWKLVEPKDVKAVIVTHDDRDHSGNLPQTLEQCPNAKFVCPIVGMARLTEEFTLPMDRFNVTNPGESYEIAGRTFGVTRPPVYDAPSSIAVYDQKSGVLFTSDCFGAFIPKPVQDVADVPPEDFAKGFMMFQSANSPWSHLLHGSKQLIEDAKTVKSIDPKFIASAHGPPGKGRTEQMLKLVADGAAAAPFKGPTQKDLEAMMAGGPPK
jgi:flavorubredoxin